MRLNIDSRVRLPTMKHSNVLSETGPGHLKRVWCRNYCLPSCSRLVNVESAFVCVIFLACERRHKYSPDSQGFLDAKGFNVTPFRFSLHVCTILVYCCAN
ncbi:unnamed protein product [Ectocarpus sp. 8 AP-2014]